MDRIVLFFIITIFFFFVNGTYKKQRNRRIVFIVLSSIVIVLASALRGLSVGPDTHQYFLLFEEVKNYSFREIWQSIVSDGPIMKDPFYWMFEKAFQLYSDNFNLYLGLVAILFCSSLGYFLYKNNLTLNELYVSYVFYLGLFYGFYSITGIRQSIAVAFIMYAYISLLDRNILLFGLFTFIAYLFHASAIVSVISFFLVRIKPIKVLVYGVLLLLPVLFVYRYEFFSNAVLFTGLEERFLQYMEGSYRGSLPILALYLAVVVGIVIKLGSIPTNSDIGKLIKIFSVCILGLPLLFVSGTAIRITQYFSVTMFVLVPYLTSSLKTKMNYLLVVLLMFLLIVIAYCDQPYVFYWE